MRVVPVELLKTTSQENIADALTKPMPGPRTVALREKVGVLPEA